MFPVYRIIFNNGISKIINLRNVSSVVLNKNIVSINYNTNKLEGMFFFGSGSIESRIHKEEIVCNNEKDASLYFDEIYKCFSKPN